MKYKKAEYKESIGSSHRGEFTADLYKLEDLFGIPYEGADARTNVEWIIKFDDGTIATIYDWKTEEDPTKNKIWTIGGNSKKAFYYIASIVTKHYKPLMKNIFGDK